MRGLDLPFFERLNRSKRVLVAGAGGGFDLFSGLPLYFALKEEGKDVHLGSLTFSNLRIASGTWLTEKVLEVTPNAGGSQHYFPERDLARWLQERGEPGRIYAFEREGVRPLADGYARLADHLNLDTVILADGGTDSLMRGDEVDLGTPEEDISSILAVQELDIPSKILVCLGFGIDAFHGVCHALFLENVAALIRTGSFLGAFSLTQEMPAVRRYREACLDVLGRTEMAHESVVCTSILSALEGHFGDYHRTHRTDGSTLFINPLMTQYWCFDIDGVARQILYGDDVRETQTLEGLAKRIDQFRGQLRERRLWKQIPV
jgi:hypothetical protein